MSIMVPSGSKGLYLFWPFSIVFSYLDEIYNKSVILTSNNCCNSKNLFIFFFDDHIECLKKLRQLLMIPFRLSNKSCLVTKQLSSFSVSLCVNGN